jgi:hypothetical protein
MKLAPKNLEATQENFSNATLPYREDVRTVTWLRLIPTFTLNMRVASATEYGISRQATLRKMFRPFAGVVSQLG